MRVIAIANRKGGVGKTTLSLALATKLPGPTLLIDLDSQANATEGLDVQKSPIIGLWLDYDQVPKLVQVMDGLYLMPGHIKTERVNLSLAQESDIAAIHRGLTTFRSRFNYVIIDCPPSLSILSRAAIYAADYVLSPTVPEYWSVAGVRQLLVTIAQIRQRFGRSVNLMGIQPNKYDRRTKEHKANLKNMVRAYGVYTQPNGRVWPPLRQSIAVAAAVSRGVPIWDVLRGHVLHEWEQMVERVRACG